MSSGKTQPFTPEQLEAANRVLGLTKETKETKPWGARPADKDDPNFGRSCLRCGEPVRAGERMQHLRCGRPSGGMYGVGDIVQVNRRGRDVIQRMRPEPDLASPNGMAAIMMRHGHHGRVVRIDGVNVEIEVAGTVVIDETCLNVIRHADPITRAEASAPASVAGAPTTLTDVEHEQRRARERLDALRALLDAVEDAIEEPKPPGPSAAQAMANAAVDLAVHVGRLDALRRSEVKRRQAFMASTAKQIDILEQNERAAEAGRKGGEG